MIRISKKIWKRLIESGTKGLVAGICFVIALSTSIYFTSAHFSKQPPIMGQAPAPATENNGKIKTPISDTNTENIITQDQSGTTTEKPKPSTAAASNAPCDEALKQKAFDTENASYDAKIIEENSRKDKALSSIDDSMEQKLSQLESFNSKPEVVALTADHSAKISALLSKKYAELMRLPRDPEGKILDLEKEAEINLRYAELQRPIDEEFQTKRAALMTGYADTRQQIYKDAQLQIKTAIGQSKATLAQLQADHQARLEQINNTCY